jgi:glyoxylase-like metal-dependent hydrolase (beta-lactamase superfamily II)
VDRRGFLAGVFATAGLVPAAALLPRQALASTRPDLEPLANGLWRVTGTATNIVVAEGPDSLLLVDGGGAEDARALERLLAQRFPGKRVAVVFNTHWHTNHSGFNATARKRGADVVAHENTRLWLGTEVNSRWNNRVYAAQPEAALPNRTFYYGPQKLDFGGRTVEYGHLGQAHTDGDIFVRFPDANVIVTGGVISQLTYPIGDPASNGWLGGLYTATKNLIDRSDVQTRFVTGTGPVCGDETLKAQSELCFTVIQRIGEAYFKGQTFEEFRATDPAREFVARLGDPAQFLRLSWDTAWYHVNEIRKVAR